MFLILNIYILYITFHKNIYLFFIVSKTMNMYAPEPKSLLILNYIEPFSSSLLWRLLMFKSKTFIEYQLRTFYRFSKLILTFSTFLICISLLIRRKPSRNNFKMCLTCKFILLLPPRNMLHFVPSIHDPLSFETRKP